MLAVEVIGFWIVVSVAFFGWRRLTMHGARIPHAMSESRKHRA